MKSIVCNVMLGLFIAVLFGMVGCGRGGGGGGGAIIGGGDGAIIGSGDAGGGNAPNIRVTTAEAGPEQNVVAGSLVTLDGSQSTGADGSLIIYQWSIGSKPVGSAATLNNSTIVNPIFMADLPGQYLLKLVVTDAKSVSSEDTVTVTATAKGANAAPVANAGIAQSVVTGIAVTLDGSASSDANGDLLTYSWAFTSKPNGSSASLPNSTVAKPTFIPDVAGSYVLNLVVNDGKVNSAAAKVTITASDASANSNAAPVANAGIAQSVVTGTVVTLDGSASSDANGDLLNYSWALTSKPNGSSASLPNSTVAKPTFIPDVAGAYVFNLVVNDGKVNSAAATVTITASDASANSNAAPVANAGIAQSVVTGTVVTLDGSASSDANGDLLTYSWAFTSRPSGSSASLPNSTVAKPTFIPDVAGAYIFNLLVNDGKLNSAASTVTITASDANDNAVPVADAGIAQSVVIGTVVTLDGSGSSDANGDMLTYSWAVVSEPSGSNAILTGTTAVKPTVTLGVVGTYVFKLVVNDGMVNSVASTVCVVAKTNNGSISVEW